MRAVLSFMLFLVALAPLLGGAAPAAAQTGEAPAPVTLPEPLTPDAVNALVSRLSDEQVRAMLIQQLDRISQTESAQSGGAELVGIDNFLGDAAGRSLDALERAVRTAPQVLTLEAKALTGYVGGLGAAGALIFAALFLAAIGVGLLVERLLHRFLMRRRRARWAEVQGRPIFEVLPFLARRLVGDLAGVLVFFVVAGVALRLAMPDGQAAVAQIFFRNLIVLPRVAAAILAFFLAPKQADERLVSVDDGAAAFLFRNLLGVVFVIGMARSLFAFNLYVEADRLANHIGFWFNLLIFCWLIWICWKARAGLRDMILHQHRRRSAFELLIARFYPVFVIVSIVATWVLSLVVAAMGREGFLRGGRHLISLAILIVAPLLDVLIRAVVTHFLPPMRGEGLTAQKAYDASFRAYVRLGRVLMFGVVVIATARIWDVTPMTMASAGVGERLAGHLISALLICIVGYICWEAVRLLINRKLANEMTAMGGPPSDDETSGHAPAAPATRLGTILPPVSWTLQAIIILLTILTMLSNLGVNVAPLLAGAGVAGIAIGFGAQKLVADIVSGLFFLMDDAFRLNEYIDVGDTAGTVERIALRSIQLRDAKGPVLIIPYSNIKSVTNFSRDWGIMKLRFTVPFDTDLDKVRKIFKRIGQEMMQIPELAPGFIEPFKSQGAAEFSDYGIVVRGKFMHKPRAQFAIRKHIFKRVQEEFAANGIEFARREVKVKVSGQTEHLTDDELNEVAGAAAEVAKPQDAKTAPT
ncbi:mechanosensitive ion channel family protein [Pikeienuella sp. HZG-20]|uniref:mechanosensitive ion channel family protein n=1 Tax=Paludibacillus litoralis TaxID=3133267 RepID=UPI0030EED01B